MNQMIARILFGSSLILGSMLYSQAGIVFNLIDGGGAGAGTQAQLGFQRAADFWSRTLADNISVNINVSMANLSPGILGGTSSNFGSVSYSGYRNSVLGRRVSANDFTFANNLPSGPSFSVYINRTSDNPNGSLSATPYVDNDGGANNTTVTMTFANAKALGLLDPKNSSLDARIQFSTNYAYDYDPSDGITSGKLDFVAIATHEIGHALGFISGVDDLDYSGSASHPANYYDSVTPLDFMRFSTASRAAGANIDWTADNRTKYFSIDGGKTVSQDNAWSLGVHFGDGRQASHWKDNLNRGLMDPTLGSGEKGVVTTLDLRAFDLLGYTLSSDVPEPTSAAIFLSSLLAFQAIRARKRRE